MTLSDNALSDSQSHPGAFLKNRPGFAWQDATPDQLRTLLVTWFSWVLGAMDTMIYSLVLTPALQDLLQTAAEPSITQAQIGWYGGLIFSIFLVGWAIGGVLLGAVADEIGRTKVLVLAVILIAVSTGAAALSGYWWHLAALRLVTGIGIGGLWAAGAALVSETWPDHSRAQAAGFLQSAWGFGFFLAAAANLLATEFGWRGSFALGIVTIASAWLIFRYTQDSPRWQRLHFKEHDPEPPVKRIGHLFEGRLRRSTWTGTALAFVAVFGLWGATNWTPSLVHSLPELTGKEPTLIAAHVSYAVMVLNVGALLGYFSFGVLANRFGRKPMFALMNAGSLLLMPLTFFFSHTYATVLLLLPILGFFSKGIFGGFPLYFPELYPTRLRSTGAGFCYNAGRIVASVSPYLTGTLVATLGSFGRAASVVALIYLFGLAILPFAPETKDRPLPE